MKLIFFILSLICGSQNIWSQSKKSTNPVHGIHAQKSATKIEQGKSGMDSNYVTKVNPKPERVFTVEYYNNLIESIESKVTSVSADSIENAKATESGWYIQMQRSLDQAKAKKLNLINTREE